ncbi:hypothetical protein [Paraburkholderia lycopersici]|uniref:Phage integrase family protein n=1 Tax=Paraburkholderia lycopersici TaxID=416944 RepID=A0A1G6M3V4_9BURK|nr:hypothetical protein [Paraburkholderia lycopersici]SDC49646.1 hypothetical protein SAMN05421548_107110 [Paraburkholderia lycopersici]
MKVKPTEFSFKPTGFPISQSDFCFQPPSWPPPQDWIVTLDSDGNPRSKWGEPVWDFSSMAGTSLKLNFARVQRTRDSELGPENQYILKMCMTWLIWGPQGYTSWETLRACFGQIRRLILLCEQNGIVASDLFRFPRVSRLIGEVVRGKEHKKNMLIMLDRLYHARETLGFVVVGEAGMRSLSEEYSAADVDDVEQTAYIPSRIWTYQVTRLRECLDDFLAHRQAVEACFNFCVDAYVNNYGSLSIAVSERESKSRFSPFQAPTRNFGKEAGPKFLGPFEETAKRFGIDILFRKWTTTSASININQFSKYFSLIQYVGLAYIGNFTLQRSAEFATLRSDCLVVEEDPIFGKMSTICGETTKTDPDSDARWPTSRSVGVAVEALTLVARMRTRCAFASSASNCSDDDVENPFLLNRAHEPWSSSVVKVQYSVRPTLLRYKKVIEKFPLLFDHEKIRITQEDLDIARRFTPNLKKSGSFSVGKIWPLAYHQLRRTGAINMFASGILSDSSIQVIMKHATVLQTRYYGKHFSRLRFNQEWEGITVAARYEVMARQMKTITEERYVSPYGEERKQQIALDLMAEKDFDHLVKEAAKGNVPFRAIRLGGCTNREHCEYGGIESISRCSGGDGHKPCTQVLYDKRKRPSAERQLESVQKKLNNAEAGSPRAEALQAEAQGLRNFLHDTE